MLLSTAVDSSKWLMVLSLMLNSQCYFYTGKLNGYVTIAYKGRWYNVSDSVNMSAELAVCFHEGQPI